MHAFKCSRNQAWGLLMAIIAAIQCISCTERIAAPDNQPIFKKTSCIRYEYDTLVTETFAYEYNDKNMLLKTSIKDIYGSTEIMWYLLNAYDTDGKLLENSTILGSNEYSNTQYEYDVNGHRIKATTRTEGSTATKTEYYYYDSAGHLVTTKTFTGDTIIYSDSVLYNASGQIEKTIVGICRPGSEKLRLLAMSGWWEYAYGTNDSLISKSYYISPDTRIEWQIYRYDNNDNLVEWVQLGSFTIPLNDSTGPMYYPYGVIYDWSTYEYDQWSNLITKIDYQNNGLIQRRWAYTYERIQ